MRRLLGCGLIVAGIVGLSAGCAKPPPPTVHAWGDSLMQQTAGPLTMGFGSRYQVAENYYPGTALCDWLGGASYDIPWAAAHNPPTVAILEFAGNNATNCISPGGQHLTGAALDNRYAQDVSTAVRLLRNAGSRVEVISTPTSSNNTLPWIGSPDLNNAEHAAAVGAGATWVDAAGQQDAPILTPARQFVRYRPCLAWEPHCGPGGLNQVRADDGIHFDPPPVNGQPAYSSGAVRYGFEIAKLTP